MSPEEAQPIIANWLEHSGTKLMAKILKKAADEDLLEYDAAILADDQEKARRIAITRWFILTEIPRIIEVHMNPAPPSPKWWYFWGWFKLRCNF
jgi:hypothetical protein